jgi:hypothetical protein
LVGDFEGLCSVYSETTGLGETVLLDASGGQDG